MQSRLPILRSSRRALAVAVVQRLVNLLERMRARFVPLAPTGQGQRFGSQAWQRIVARWPALDLLLKDRIQVGSSIRPPPAPSSPPSATGRVSDQESEALIARLRGSSSWQSRAQSAQALAACHAPGVVEALLSALWDPSAEVAVAVVSALSLHLDRRAEQALRDVLTNAEGYFSPITRVAALNGLAGRVTRGDYEELLMHSLWDVDAELSIAAIAALARHAPSLLREQLLPVLRDEAGFFLPVVRLAAATALENAKALSRSEAAALLVRERDESLCSVLSRVADTRASA